MWVFELQFIKYIFIYIYINGREIKNIKERERRCCETKKVIKIQEKKITGGGSCTYMHLYLG
jgi:hypothetical protein